MAATPSDRYEAEIARINWDALRASARHGLRTRMGGLTGEDVDDAVQDVAERYVRFVRRNGMPHSPEGFLFELVRRVAANNIQRRQRERRLEMGDAPAWVRSPEGEADEDEVLRQYAIMVFHVQEYFRIRKAGCVALANAKSRGDSLKDHAAAHGFSYDKIRQDWARCVKLIHDAMRAKRLRLTWPTPRPKRRPGA